MCGYNAAKLALRRTVTNTAPSRHRAARAQSRCLLTTVGGFVDAVGYIALFEVFTANMSGNSIHIGMYLGQHNWLQTCCGPSAPSCPTLWE